MEYYILLAFASIIILGFALLIWLRTKEISFILGIGLIYYFTLFGAWVIVYDGLTGNAGAELGFRYYYLFDKLFPVYLDEDYFIAIFYYSLFIIFVELAVLFTIRKKERNFNKDTTPIHISHFRILVFSILAGIASFFIVKEYILSSIILGKSAYILTRTTEIPLFTIHQVLNRMLIVPLIIGFAVYLSGKKGRYIIGKNSKFIGLAYISVLLFSFGYLVVLGNKNELFLGVVSGVLFYLVNNKQPEKSTLFAIAVISFASLAYIDFARGSSPDSISQNINLQYVIVSMYGLLFSNEVFASHFSMYGVLHYNVPITYGYSVLSFIVSVIPRIFWPDRLPDVYAHYAEYVGATPGQGYTINHATGWYLNFGLPGIIIGAIIFGWIWASLFNRFWTIGKKHSKKPSLFLYVFTLLAPWTFTAAIPALMRAGLEGYKGLIIESFLVPTIMITLACLKIKF